jgi:hypothetical protein
LILLPSLRIDEIVRTAKNFEVPEKVEHFSEERKSHVPWWKIGTSHRAANFERSNIPKLIIATPTVANYTKIKPTTPL